MGEGEFSVQVPTRLTAGPGGNVNVSQAASKGYLQFDNIRADLKAAGVSLAGEQVEFKADGVTICTDTTNNVGRASCTGGKTVDVVKFGGSVPTSFTATFAGDGGLQGDTDTATLTQVG